MLAPRQKSKGDVIGAPARSAHHVQRATFRASAAGAVPRLYAASEGRADKLQFPLYINPLKGCFEGVRSAAFCAGRHVQPTAQIHRPQR